MALVCPVGHPPGAGTTFCRLCGRPYIESADLPADSALAVMAAQRETLDQVRAAVTPAAALPVPEPTSEAPGPLTAPDPAPAGRMVPPPPGAPPLRTQPPAPGAPLVPAQPVGSPQAPDPSGGVHIQMPLVPVAPLVPYPALDERAEPTPDLPPADGSASQDGERSEPAVPARGRSVVLVATVAGFVGGALSGAGIQYLLG